jgi:hypothetical protein
VQAQGLAADSSDLGFRCYLGSSTRELQKYDRVIISMESLLNLSRDPPAVGGAELEPAPTYDVVVLDEIVSLAAAFGGVTMHCKTNATVELLQRICMNASYIFASDADWDERAELLVRNLKGTQLLPAVLFDVAAAPMQRQMQLYFAGSGNATRKQTGGKNPKPIPAVVKVPERLGAELNKARADKSYRIAVACGNRSKQVRWVQDLATDKRLLWSLRQYHGQSGADVKDYDFRQAIGNFLLGRPGS